jgi:hypothetical protein
MSAPKIVLWNSFFVISGVVNRHFLNNYLSYKSFQTAKKVPKDNFWSPYENQQNGSTLDFLRNGSNVVPQILKNKKAAQQSFYAQSLPQNATYSVQAISPVVGPLIQATGR